ncbi:MAG: hypothetical protein AAF797_02285 [Planctomycetota bacterium]
MLLCTAVAGLAGCGSDDRESGVHIDDLIENAEEALRAPARAVYARGFTAGLTAESDEPPVDQGETGRQGSVYRAGFRVARALRAKGDDPDAHAAIEQIRALIEDHQPQSYDPATTPAWRTARSWADPVSPGLVGLQRRPDA